MSYATLADLRAHLGPTAPADDPVYAAKMLHDLPKVKIADRVGMFVQFATGKRVLEFGASGPLSVKLRAVAKAYCGIDRKADPAASVIGCDLDDVSLALLPSRVDPDVIVCGEVLEHLANPGWFLMRVRKQWPGVPVIISVPNAYSAVGQKWMLRGKENVNADHVAWYSPKTLSVLLERVGFKAGDLFFYGGTNQQAEGLLVVAE